MAYPHLPEVDLHTHTIASGHAFSTISEIASAAAAKGLRGIGTTDHGPALPGGPHPYHFHALRFIPPYLRGVRILRGIEANIGIDGALDLTSEEASAFEVVLAAPHSRLRRNEDQTARLREWTARGAGPQQSPCA